MLTAPPPSTPAANTVLLTGTPSASRAAAEAIAHSTGRELLRVDLGALTSKYIGEREKNLDRVLANADPSRSILFFDEADALFGKRSEVKDSHDRYAPYRNLIPSATPGVLLRHGHLCHHFGGQTSLRKTVPAHPPPSS